MINESDTVREDAPLHQGDIFEFLNKNSLWENYGIVITTDCDIAWGKNSDVYSYCPIINLKEYFYQIYLPKQIEYDKILGKAKGIIDKHNGNNNKGVDINIISQWIKDRGIEGALEDINIKTDDMKNAVSFLYNFDEKICIMQMFLNYRNILDSKGKNNKEIEKLKSNFKNHIVHLPGDLFYINYIHGVNEMGYIVNLRRIGIFNRENISISNYDNGEKVYLKRIAKMVSPFNYRITQRVAQMFSDIGLPEDYEDDRNSTIDILFSGIRSEYE
jgi:hypothetical protein